MTEIEGKKEHDDKTLSWFTWFVLFLLSQVAFVVIEYFSWPLLGANRFGERVVDFIQLEKWFHFHQHPLANLLTLVFGVALILNGVVQLIEKRESKKKCM